jgi:group I intron endonuclease
MVMKNFSLTIIEYCSPEKCIEREDFYLSSEKPGYNILQKAGSWLGHKHSEEARKIMSDIAKKIENSGRFKIGQSRAEGSGRPSQAIEVFDQVKKWDNYLWFYQCSCSSH